MPSGLDAFRRATGQLHKDVELTATMSNIVAPTFSTRAYVSYLRALGAAIRPLGESRIQFTAPADLPCSLVDGAWQLLDDDLQKLGASSPHYASPPPLCSEAEFWGRLYVVRGAEAGMALLNARVSKAPEGALVPRSFLTHAHSRRHEWPAICAALDGLEGAKLQEASQAATRDFEYAKAAIVALESEGCPEEAS